MWAILSAFLFLLIECCNLLHKCNSFKILHRRTSTLQYRSTHQSHLTSEAPKSADPTPILQHIIWNRDIVYCMMVWATFAWHVWQHSQGEHTYVPLDWWLQVCSPWVCLCACVCACLHACTSYLSCMCVHVRTYVYTWTCTRSIVSSLSAHPPTPPPGLVPSWLDPPQDTSWTCWEGDGSGCVQGWVGKPLHTHTSTS